MYLCYIDESGTADIPGTTSHYVLVGLCIPIYKWKVCEANIDDIKRRFNLLGQEIHTGWLIRNYTEQNKISNFSAMSQPQRRSEVERYRRAELLRLQSSPSHNKQYKQTKKNYEKTKAFIHLTLDERKEFVMEVARAIGTWGFARLFGECIDKIFFDPSKAPAPADEQAFEQLVTRFEHYLKSIDTTTDNYGMLIHDNNQTVAKRHTDLMKHFHSKGTLWTALDNIIETPLFVDSSLTSMIQIVDVAAYAIRRYLENQEEDLFNEIFKRAHRVYNRTVGIRHFSAKPCLCKICASH